VGEALHSGLALSSALASAIARLHRMRKSDLEFLLEKHLPTDMLTNILQPMQTNLMKAFLLIPTIPQAWQYTGSSELNMPVILS